MALISPSENKYRAEAALATSPLMKFANILPSSEVSNLSSLPDTASSALRPGANQAPGPVPTTRFLTVSPVYSSNPTAGLLRPAPEHGVHLVFRVPFHIVRQGAQWQSGNGPQDAWVHTLLRIP